MPTLSLYTTGSPQILQGTGWSLWVALHDAAAADAQQDTIGCRLKAHTTSNYWGYLVRGMGCWDTSVLGASATIVGARLKVPGYRAANSFASSPLIGVYKASPASQPTIALADWDTYGILISDEISLADVPTATGSYQIFTLTQAGLDWINKTGYTSLALLFDWDYDNSPPTWEANKEADYPSWSYTATRFEIDYAPFFPHSFGVIID